MFSLYMRPRIGRLLQWQQHNWLIVGLKAISLPIAG
jgi:hypothetical protein